MLNRIDFTTGKLEKVTGNVVRRASDMIGFFSNTEELQKLIDSGNPIIYEVYEWKFSDEHGNLSYAVTVLRSGDVGGEFYMTKGHYHEKEEMGELYICLKGKGVLIMQNREGDVKWMEITPGTIAYVPPRYAHRSVNVGEDELIFLAIYPSDAGHNYGEIKERGFRKLVIKKEKGYEVIENERYR